MRNRGRGRELDHVEAALRDARPEPRPELVDRLAARMESDSHPSQASASHTPVRSRRRLVLTTGFATVFLVVFAAFGGLGYAKSAVTGETGPKVKAAGVAGASGSSSHGEQSDPAGHGNGNGNGNGGSSAHHQYHHFTLVCIHGETPVLIPVDTASRLIAEGKATLPPCSPKHHS